MRTAVKAVFWVTASSLLLSLVLTVLGSSLNLEGVLRAGAAGWLLSCLALFAWMLLLAYASFRLRREGRLGRAGIGRRFRGAKK